MFMFMPGKEFVVVNENGLDLCIFIRHIFLYTARESTRSNEISSNNNVIGYLNDKLYRLLQ